ncbi:MAG TPA: multicopper oxidase domain-containing protein [Solirubrobacteraceae bacterium]
MQQTGPATAPHKRGPAGGERHPDHRHVELRLVDRVAALERAAAEEQPLEAPQRASRWTALIIWLAVATGLAGGLLLAHRVPGNGSSSKAAPAGATAATQAPAGHQHGEAAGAAAAPSSKAVKNVKAEHYKRPSPLLPAIPPGPVKHFRVDVDQHITRVSPDLHPMEVWSFGINGRFLRGTGASPPMVVNVGDRVSIDFVNGASKKMGVTLPHSLDLHAEGADPTHAFVTIAPGARHRETFIAKHPGIFMYHCVSAPALLHVGAGMAGMLVVKPKHLKPVDRELWLTQQEFYPSKNSTDPDYAAMQKKDPAVVAFNGYAGQYVRHPIKVKKGERVRLYLLNAGDSLWSAFHVIGAVFDRTVIEGQIGHDAQTVSLAPSQGGYVEFKLDHEGSYPFVTHAFSDAAKGADGAFRTPHATGPVMAH